MTFHDAPRVNTQHAAARLASSTAICIHHWLIDAPSGATSLGTCRHCGTARNFSNGSEFSSWEHAPTEPSEFVRAARAALRSDLTLADERL